MALRSVLLVLMSSLAFGCVPDDAATDELTDVAIPAQAATPPAPASAPAYQGAGLARQVCAQCHHVTAGPAPAGLPAASFVEIANRDGVSAETIRDWLNSTHPSMPNFMFDASSVDDMAAYIMSLRTAD